MKTLLPMGLLLLALAGCAGLPAPGGTDTRPVARDAEVIVPPPQEGETTGPSPAPAPDAQPLRAAAAVVELQQQARTASGDGDHDRAAALLERALRMEPRNPALWHNLAIVRYRQHDYPQTESMALRSNGFAQGHHDLARRNWELIAEARERRGDASGADDARRRAERLAAGGG